MSTTETQSVYPDAQRSGRECAPGPRQQQVSDTDDEHQQAQAPVPRREPDGKEGDERTAAVQHRGENPLDELSHDTPATAGAYMAVTIRWSTGCEAQYQNIRSEPTAAMAAMTKTNNSR